MKLLARPLAGLTVGLSLSESEDSTRRGFPSWQVNRVTLQVVAALFGQGAGIVFGHDWREDGVMEAVHGLARQMQPPDPISPEDAQTVGQPLLQNLLPWPDTPRLSPEDREQLASTLRVEQADLPEELCDYAAAHEILPTNDTLYTYLRARGLTHLRHQLNDRCDARICIGGRCGGSQGRYPGVIEEALLALKQTKPLPLYLAGLLGGATRQVINAIEGRPMPEDFCRSDKIEKLYHATSPGASLERSVETRADRVFEPRNAWATFQQAKPATLAQFNGLTEHENSLLFYTPVLDHAIELVLTGLSRL